MVHFDSRLEVLHRPTAPPVCPKCGSHRTEVIGKLDDTEKRIVRCNTCGAISTITINGEEAVAAGVISAA